MYAFLLHIFCSLDIFSRDEIHDKQIKLKKALFWDLNVALEVALHIKNPVLPSRRYVVPLPPPRETLVSSLTLEVI